MHRVLSLALALLLMPLAAIEAADPPQCKPEQMRGKWQLGFSPFGDTTWICNFRITTLPRVVGSCKDTFNGVVQIAPYPSSFMRVRRTCTIEGRLAIDGNYQIIGQMASDGLTASGSALEIIRDDISDSEFEFLMIMTKRP